MIRREKVQLYKNVLTEVDKRIASLSDIELGGDQATELVVAQLGDRIEYADKDLYNVLISDLQSGKIEHFEIKSGGRINLTKPGGYGKGGKVVRMRMTRIMRNMGMEY